MAIAEDKHEVFATNLIKVAVAEVRFPALLDVPTSTAQRAQKALRKRYPEYAKQRRAETQEDDAPETERHLFRSRGRDWTMVLKPFAFALETRRYVDFHDFEARFSEVAAAIVPLLDSDYSTRVGLRYVNDIPLGDSTPEGWVVSELLGLQSLGVLDGIEHVIQGATGSFEDCSYKFRHGVLRDEQEGTVYRLDADYFIEDVDFSELSSALATLHSRAFSVFRKCLGPKTLSHMRREKN